jgi:hypothetical protein
MIVARMPPPEVTDKIELCIKPIELPLIVHLPLKRPFAMQSTM